MFFESDSSNLTHQHTPLLMANQRRTKEQLCEESTEMRFKPGHRTAQKLYADSDLAVFLQSLSPTFTTRKQWSTSEIISTPPPPPPFFFFLLLLCEGLELFLVCLFFCRYNMRMILYLPKKMLSCHQFAALPRTVSGTGSHNWP